MELILKTDIYCKDFEVLSLKINNNKYYLFDLINQNIKIKIKKNIPVKSKYGMFLLYYLGYDIEYDIKIILECNYISKNNCLFNNYKDVLFIISFNNYNIIMYKFNKINNNYKYTKTFIQDNV